MVSKLSLRSLAVGACISFGTVVPAFGQEAPSWCKSKWGPDDEIGAANLITPESVLAASKLVKTGKSYALGVETNRKTPAFGPRTWALVITQPGQVGGVGLGPTKTNYNDDIYMGYVGTGSQLDGLGHIGIDNIYYNCHRTTSSCRPTAWSSSASRSSRRSLPAASCSI